MARTPSPAFTIASRVLVVTALVLVFFGWIMTTPPGFSSKLDAIGYAVCHRIPDRSFHLVDYQLPLCARCSGMYLGAMLGLAFQAILSRRKSGLPPWKVLIPLIILIIVFGIDGSNSYLYLIKQTYPGALANLPNLYIPNNSLRLFTGSGMGIVISTAMFPAFNQTVWKLQEPAPALGKFRDLLLLLVIVIMADLLVLTGSAWVLYPLIPITSLGVLFLLTMIHAILWMMIFRQENRFERLAQAWFPLLAGLTIGILQIALIDALRFWLTGTWGTFPLG